MLRLRHLQKHIKRAFDKHAKKDVKTLYHMHPRMNSKEDYKSLEYLATSSKKNPNQKCSC